MVLKVFEMFAGYGGASFALKKAGIEFECVGYSEINKHAIKCYDKNHQKGAQVHKDTNEYTSIPRNFGDATKIKVEELPDFDLLTGGFPCQAFSQAGKRKGFEDTRGTLIYDILRIANHKRPKYMLLENVKGIMSHDNGNTIKTILYAIKDLGYDVHLLELNSKEYGTPQNRERVYFVCKLGEWNMQEFKQPLKQKLKIFLKDILEPNVDEKYYLSEQQINKMLNGDRWGDRWGDHVFSKDTTVSNSLLAIGQCDVGVINIADFRYDEGVRVRKDNIAPTLTSQSHFNSLSGQPLVNTITTAYGKQGNSNEFKDINLKVYNTINQWRRLTPKECFRLMGFFNDEINLDGISDSQKYKLAGNGWDINVVSQIFRGMFK